MTNDASDKRSIVARLACPCRAPTGHRCQSSTAAAVVDAPVSYAAEKLDACADAVSGGDVERADLDFRVAESHGRLDLASTPLSAAAVSVQRGGRRAVIQLQAQPTALGHSRLTDHRDARTLRRVDADNDLRLVHRRRTISADNRLTHRHFLQLTQFSRCWFTPYDNLYSPKKKR